MEASFTKIQKNLVHKMRKRLAACVSIPELASAFSEIGDRLMAAVFEKTGISIPGRSVAFSANGSTHYQISQKLREDESFMLVWSNSDLPAIMDRFAHSAYHRYLHLKSTPDRVNVKIRH